MKAEGSRRTRPRVFAIVAIVACTIGCDRVSKHFAARELVGSPRQSYLADTLRVEYVENRGGFLSMGASLPERTRTLIFVLGTAVMLVGLTIGLVCLDKTTCAAVGLSLIWSGGVSNLIDRLARGYVVDFLNVGVGPLRTGIFNVADLAITCGVALVLLGGWRARHP
jgi:signal peptidase II